MIPAGALHAEGRITEPVTYIVTMRDPQPFLQAFSMMDPAAWPEPKRLALDPDLVQELAKSMPLV